MPAAPTPPEDNSQDVTELIGAWRRGDPAALEGLLPLVYEDLRRRAHACLRQERSGHTLQTTDLVHEAYLKLAGGGEGEPGDTRAVSGNRSPSHATDPCGLRACAQCRQTWGRRTSPLVTRFHSGRGAGLVDVIALDAALIA